MLTIFERAILKKSKQHPYEIEVSVLCRVENWAMVQRRATARPFVCTVDELRPVRANDKNTPTNTTLDKKHAPLCRVAQRRLQRGGVGVCRFRSESP
jgi:hypothetical protein